MNTQGVSTELGARIRAARKRYGMSQTVLAERIGLSKTSLSLIESGETKDPRYSVVKAIARTLGMRVDDLDPQDTTPPAGSAPLRQPGIWKGKLPPDWDAHFDDLDEELSRLFEGEDDDASPR